MAKFGWPSPTCSARHSRKRRAALGRDVVSRGARTFRYLYVLDPDAFMDGTELTRARPGRDPQFNQSQVQFELSRTGGRQFR